MNSMMREMMQELSQPMPPWLVKYQDTLNQLRRTGFTNKISEALMSAKQKMEETPIIGRGSVFHFRRDFCARFGWGIPSADGWWMIAETVSGHKVVELGAGSGFLAACIMANPNDKPASYVATDAMTGHHTFTSSYYRVQKRTHLQTLEEHPDADVLVLNWPTYADPWACEALKEFKGDTVIYIGEDWGGCTADDGFFEELDEKWELQQSECCIQWQGIHDAVCVYKRLEMDE